MKKFKKILGINILLLSTGCIANPYPPTNENSCPALSQTFNYYKYEKMNCIVTNKNMKNDKEACIESETQRFQTQFTQYIQPFYDIAGEIDEQKKLGQKINKIVVPKIDLPYSSSFCYNLEQEITKAFNNEESIVNSLNTVFSSIVSTFRTEINLNPVVKELPKECFGILDSLLSYQIDSGNKRDDYYFGFRKEYMECIQMYSPSKEVIK